jgi:hypothetical protein
MKNLANMVNASSSVENKYHSTNMVGPGHGVGRILGKVGHAQDLLGGEGWL